MSLVETFRCECGYEQGPFGTRGYDPKTGTGDVIGSCRSCRTLGVLRLVDQKPSGACRCGRPLVAWDGSCPRCGSRSCGFQPGAPASSAQEVRSSPRTAEEIAADQARWAAERATADAELEREKDELRRRTIEAGLGSEADVDDVISKMDLATFKRLRGELERVARMHFKKR